MLWLLSQPPERGGLGFDPISARKLTIEAALFYIADESTTKKRCLVENADGDLEGYRETLKEQAKAEKIRLREHYTGSKELKWD